MKPKLKGLGKSTSPVEVTQVSLNGIWLLIHDREYFLPFDDFPWFKNAPISDIHSVEFSHDTHLYWPALDIDLSMAILENLESYPLIAK